MTTTRQIFTVRAAVESCQVSEKTIRRHLPALKEHGAERDDDGQWRIPVEALLAVGLRPGKPKGPDRRERDQDDQVDVDQVTSNRDQANVWHDQGHDQALIHRAEKAEERIEQLENRLRDKDDLIVTLKGNVEDLRRQLPPVKPQPAIDPAPIQQVVDQATRPLSPEVVAAEVPAPMGRWRRIGRNLFG